MSLMEHRQLRLWVTIPFLLLSVGSDTETLPTVVPKYQYVLLTNPPPVGKLPSCL
jgi:hypothetical protein